MEEDSSSPLQTTPRLQKHLEKLEKVVSEGQKRVEYAVAHDPVIQQSIEIVERFLRKSKRVCYGGQAINAALPKEKQFYDETTTVPDYDFFTPTLHEDVDELMKELEAKGLPDVKKKVGIHDGTFKIYVKFIPVADCSEMESALYTSLRRRAMSVNGILYADPDFLRMMMYLELSRPRGQVERWKKVYERLLLINKQYPVGQCTKPIRLGGGPGPEIRAKCLTYCIRNKRVLIGPDVISMLASGHSSAKLGDLISADSPVMFMSPQARLDAEDIADVLDLRLTVDKEMYEFTEIYDAILLRKGRSPVAVILQETACHAYTVLKLNDGAEIRIAVPDLLLHIYYSFLIFGKKTKGVFADNLECLIQTVYAIGEKARDAPSHLVPAFGLRCSGRQPGFGTLLKVRDEKHEKLKGKGKGKGAKMLGGFKTRSLARLRRGRQTRRV